MKKGMIKEFTKIGRVLKTHGLEGGLVIDIDPAYLELFGSSRFVFLDLNGSIVPFLIEGVQQEDPLIIFLEDITDPESAAQIAPADLLLPSHEVPDAPSREEGPDFSWATGFTVVSGEQVMVGQILRVESYPQQSMAFVSWQGREIMLPLHDELIMEVDDAAKSIKLEIAEGLLDLQD